MMDDLFRTPDEAIEVVTHPTRSSTVRFDLRNSWISDGRQNNTKRASIYSASFRRCKSERVPNFSRRGLPLERLEALAAITEMDLRSKCYSSSGILRNSCRDALVKRFDGHTRSCNQWDGLRRDDELWFPEGDCLVYFYNRGASRRGPSLRVPFNALKNSNCGPLFTICFAQTAPRGDSQPASAINSSRPATPGGTPLDGAKFELYVPSPDALQREDSFMYHLTTRNFFAWMFGKPLIGTHLGKAMVKVLERMRLYRGPEAPNAEDFLAYLDGMGYLDFTNYPDYALAALHLAEEAKLQDLWVDAFAHTVGMNDELCMSWEFQPISRVTKALITRAALDMDLHQSRVERSMGNFLEDELSAAQIGLSDAARSHLERFRSFLHSFYVGKFSYWPPPRQASFSKALYRSMYFEFRSLYDFMVDTSSTDAMQAESAASGGVCVYQSLQAFDERHKFEPLPHRFPLLPKYEERANRARTQSQKGLRALRLANKHGKSDRVLTVRAALSAATNTKDIRVTSCALVREYSRFEKEWTTKPEEKISIHEARNIRWILVYSVLQMLISATKAPKEVRDAESPYYSLACYVPELPFKSDARAAVSIHSFPSATDFSSSQSTHLTVPSDGEDGRTSIESRISIHPDCEGEDYFSDYHHRRQPSGDSYVPEPLHISKGSFLRKNGSLTSLSRGSSLRKSLNLSKTFTTGSRRSSLITTSPTQSNNFQESLVHGRGNVLNRSSIKGRSSSHSSIIVTRSDSHSSISPSIFDVTPRVPIINVPTPKRRSEGFFVQGPLYNDQIRDPRSQMRTPTLDSTLIDKSCAFNGKATEHVVIPSNVVSEGTAIPFVPQHNRFPSSSSTYSEAAALHVYGISPVSPLDTSFGDLSDDARVITPATNSHSSTDFFDYRGPMPGLSYSSSSSIIDLSCPSSAGHSQTTSSNDLTTFAGADIHSFLADAKTAMSFLHDLGPNYSSDSDEEQFTRGRALRRTDDAELAAKNSPQRAPAARGDFDFGLAGPTALVAVDHIASQERLVGGSLPMNSESLAALEGVAQPGMAF